VSQKIEDKADAAEARTHETRGFMQRVRVAARRKYTPEEKVRIVLEGFRRELFTLGPRTSWKQGRSGLPGTL